MRHQIGPLLRRHGAAQQFLELGPHSCNALIRFNVVAQSVDQTDDSPEAMPSAFQAFEVNAQPVSRVSGRRSARQDAFQGWGLAALAFDALARGFLKIGQK